MTSSDRELLITIYEGQIRMEGRLDGVEHRLDGVEGRLDGVEARQQVMTEQIVGLQTEVTMLRHDVENLQTSVYWVLGAIGIFIAGLAIPAFVLSIMSLMHNVKPESKPEPDSRTFDELERRLTERLLPKLKQ